MISNIYINELLFNIVLELSRRQNSVSDIRGYMSRNGDFQQCGILTSVDSDEPERPPF